MKRWDLSSLSRGEIFMKLEGQAKALQSIKHSDLNQDLRNGELL